MFEKINKKCIAGLLFSFVIFCVLIPAPLKAADMLTDQVTIVKAKVIEVVDQGTDTLPGIDVQNPTQTLKAQIIEGTDNGKIVEFKNDYTILKAGDLFYLSYTVQTEGNEFYSVYEPDRLPVLLFFLILFVVLALIFGGLQGLRGLLSLAGSLLLIIFVLLPAILHGFSPLLVSIVVSSLIIILGSYVTHGFNKTTSSAVIGMIITVIITGLMAYYAVDASRLTGATGDEAIYLTYNTRGHIDLIGILMGGIMIGLLGVLYDVSIGQAISVEELHHVAPHLPRWKIYKRAIRIGREHIGALINTLAIAYVGASLPLLLLFYSSGSDTPFLMTINKEIFSTEIIRTLIGSIGLVLAVPITTLLSTVMLIQNKKEPISPEALKTEEENIEHAGHVH